MTSVSGYGNRSTDGYPYYKELTKDPDARYMKLKLVEKCPRRAVSAERTKRKRAYEHSGTEQGNRAVDEIFG